MSLSRETERRLVEAKDREKTYFPHEDIMRKLGNSSLTMTVGPAAIGKSFLMNRVAQLDERFGRSSVLSTRHARSDDEPGLFRLYEHSDENIDILLRKIETQSLVQYAIHPTELTFYGSELEDHPYQNNMLATLSGSIDQLQHVGFGHTTVIALTAPPSDWQKWFDARYKYSDPSRLKRLTEAEDSYTNLLKRKDVSWVINHEGAVDEAATDIVHVTDGKKLQSEEAIAYAQRILQLIETEKQRVYRETHD